jgi:transposase
METGTRAPRRRHSDELKARVLAACDETGASVAAVAQAHGLNANLVHKWRRGRGVPALTTGYPVRSAVAASAEFIALALPTAAVASGQPITAAVADIRIEWRRGAAAIAVSWPISAAPECARWLLQCMGAK